MKKKGSLVDPIAAFHLRREQPGDEAQPEPDAAAAAAAAAEDAGALGVGGVEEEGRQDRAGEGKQVAKLHLESMYCRVPGLRVKTTLRIGDFNAWRYFFIF